MKLRIICALAVIFFLTLLCLQDDHTPKPAADARWQKIASDGSPLGAWQGPWDCVLDVKTGLIWEAKRDDEALHDSYWSCTWFNGARGVAKGGSCYFEHGGCDTLDLIQRVNQAQLCGQNNWRLPSTEELQSLVSPALIAGSATIRTDYFPNTKAGDYWTSNADIPLTKHFQYLSPGAQAISFLTGDVIALPYRNAAFVRLVSQPILQDPAISKAPEVQLTHRDPKN